MFGFGGYDVFITIGFIAIHYFFSTRNNVYWGVAVPAIFVSWLTWTLFTDHMSVLAYVLILLVGFIVLSMEWSEGREALRKRRKKELDKMSTYDIK